MTIEIPILQSERLRLRGHRPEDHANCTALWGDPEVSRYIGGRPLSGEEAWARLLRYAGHWVWMGYGFWAVEEKIGNICRRSGYASLHRDIQPPLHMPEFGWVLATPFHGRGYATEAVRTATAWGDQQFGAQQTICIIDPENLRSIRVAEKCRFKVSHQASYKGGSIIVFAR